jgi:hypothetical protein
MITTNYHTTTKTKDYLVPSYVNCERSMIATTITIISRFLNSIHFHEGSNITSNFTTMKDDNINSTLYDEPNGTSSNVPGNETSSLLQDELTHSPVSLMLYGGVLVLFVCIPLGMECYNYLKGRGLYLFRTSTETVHPESKEQSVGNGKKSRLMLRLDQNSMVCISREMCSE